MLINSRYPAVICRQLCIDSNSIHDIPIHVSPSNFAGAVIEITRECYLIFHPITVTSTEIEISCLPSFATKKLQRIFRTLFPIDIANSLDNSSAVALRNRIRTAWRGLLSRQVSKRSPIKKILCVINLYLFFSRSRRDSLRAIVEPVSRLSLIREASRVSYFNHRGRFFGEFIRGFPECTVWVYG